MSLARPLRAVVASTTGPGLVGRVYKMSGEYFESPILQFRLLNLKFPPPSFIADAPIARVAKAPGRPVDALVA
jgi:hypothetical protein